MVVGPASTAPVNASGVADSVTAGSVAGSGGAESAESIASDPSPKKPQPPKNNNTGGTVRYRRDRGERAEKGRRTGIMWGYKVPRSGGDVKCDPAGALVASHA